MQSIENRRYRTKKHPVSRRTRASFSADILQAGAVKGSKVVVYGHYLNCDFASRNAEGCVQFLHDDAASF